MQLRERQVDLLAITTLIGWLLVCTVLADVVSGTDLAAVSVLFGYLVGHWHGVTKCRMRYTAATDASTNKGHGS